MKEGNHLTATLILIIVLGIIGFVVIGIFNTVKRNGVKVDTAFADLDVFLQKRWDQLENLAGVAKAATKAEIDIITNVTSLRSGINNAPTPDEKIKAYKNVESEIKGISMQLENYPEVKFNENYLHIQRTINEIEDQIQAARRNYNANVERFNLYIATFPTNVIANLLGFKNRVLFETNEQQRKAPNTNDLFGV